MRCLQVRSLLCCTAAIISAALGIAVIVTWVRSYPHAGQIKSTTVRESATAHVVVDAYSMQARQGVLWVGRARTRLGVAEGIPLKFVGDRSRVEAAAGNLGVLSMLSEAQPTPNLFLGAGMVDTLVSISSGRSARDGWEGEHLVELDSRFYGIVVPCWMLTLVFFMLPAVWWIRRRACRKAYPNSPAPISPD